MTFSHTAVCLGALRFAQNMAVSNAIGSNVFDICLGIGLPYLIKTALVSPGSTIMYVLLCVCGV